MSFKDFPNLPFFLPEDLLQDPSLKAINLFSHEHAVGHECVGGLLHLLPHNVVVVKKKFLLKPRLVGLLGDPSIPLTIGLWRFLTVVALHAADISALPGEQPDSLGALVTCVACTGPPDFLLEEGQRGCLRRPPCPACSRRLREWRRGGLLAAGSFNRRRHGDACSTICGNTLPSVNLNSRICKSQLSHL